MNLEQFERLPVSCKCSYTQQKGTKLLTIEEYFVRIELYSVGNFYVELWHHLRYGTIFKLYRYHSISPDSPYLKRINISSLFYDEGHVL